ncbi:hypothetical protein TrST_g8308 [Triparma strigata]|nr:hypothetical protein TrST_g8308 [Triparma strigata]
MTPQRPSDPAKPSSSPRPRTARELKESRKAEFAQTASNIAHAHKKADNIHKEALPTYVPQRIQDNVETCYFMKEQHGWTPLENVDPTSTSDNDKHRPSFKLWYEYEEVTGHNPEGVEKFKDSPRLYNYNRRAKQSSTPFKPDTTRGALEGRVASPVKRKQGLEEKITKIDGAVGREGWRAHVTMGNGVVRWTDDVFDWQNMKMVPSENLNENGKSTFLFPNELAPMYSSFTPDKIYRWKPPRKSPKKKSVPKLTKSQLVEISEIRRQNMEKNGTIHGSKPSPRSTTLTLSNGTEWKGTFPLPSPSNNQNSVMTETYDVQSLSSLSNGTATGFKVDTRNLKGGGSVTFTLK